VQLFAKFTGPLKTLILIDHSGKQGSLPCSRRERSPQVLCTIAFWGYVLQTLMLPLQLQAFLSCFCFHSAEKGISCHLEEWMHARFYVVAAAGDSKAGLENLGNFYCSFF